MEKEFRRAIRREYGQERGYLILMLPKPCVIDVNSGKITGRIALMNVFALTLKRPLKFPAVRLRALGE